MIESETVTSETWSSVNELAGEHKKYDMGESLTSYFGGVHKDLSYSFLNIGKEINDHRKIYQTKRQVWQATLVQRI